VANVTEEIVVVAVQLEMWVYGKKYVVHEQQTSGAMGTHYCTALYPVPIPTPTDTHTTQNSSSFGPHVSDCFSCCAKPVNLGTSHTSGSSRDHRNREEHQRERALPLLVCRVLNPF